jgi:hypothetical protein
MKQLRTRREGSTLAFTLVLLTLFLVVGAAVLTASMSAVTTSQLTGARQQAYYTARSAVSVTVKQIESDGTFVAGLGLSQSNRSVTGTAKGNDVSEQAMLAGGNCTVKVEATAFDSNGSPSAIKVTATATKGGATASAARVLTAGKSAAPDFSYTFYSTSNLSLGDISVVNDASIAGNSGKSICCGGDVSIINDLKWRELNTYGDIYTAGSFYMDTYYQNNNLFGSVYAQKNAGASLGCYIYGNLTYGGLLSYWLKLFPPVHRDRQREAELAEYLLHDAGDAHAAAGAEEFSVREPEDNALTGAGQHRVHYLDGGWAVRRSRQHQPEKERVLCRYLGGERISARRPYHKRLLEPILPFGQPRCVSFHHGRQHGLFS